ncbi:hypothetical protein HNQ94_001142 [Salirhabdus euzebyi]|uniref:Spore coat protein n=1 Tax=Salirhabdus euzebyi TaxID=394506 RepID=A0A841PYF9_9BACI|nr:spore coat protein [Salirhabdus euzebyi]MBB6452696.1 hypothetical protein [Salirhabdus euzebyi]
MNPLIEKLIGVADLSDQVIATDILMAAKAEIRNYAVAITESASPEVRQSLTQQIEEVIHFHEQISNYMIEKGFYHPHDVPKQLDQDMHIAQTALNLGNN